MILEAALRTPILTPKLLATRFRFPVWRSLLFSGGKRFVRCWTLLGPGDPLFDKWPYRGPWWARCSDTCFSRNTDPVFSKTRTLFFQKHGSSFFKNMGPVFSKKWVQKLEKNGAASWGILEVHISRFSVAKTIAGRGLFCANFLGFLHIFGLRWWERRRSYFGKNSFHISAKKHFIFPQKVVSHFLKKAFHISPKKHSIFPQKCTLYF